MFPWAHSCTSFAVLIDHRTVFGAVLNTPPTFSSSPPVSSILFDYFIPSHSSLSSDGSHPLSNNDSLIGVKVPCNYFLHNRMHNYACALPLRANRPALSWALHLSLLVPSLTLLSLKCRRVFSLTNPCHKVAEQTVCWPEGEMMFSHLAV